MSPSSSAVRIHEPHTKGGAASQESLPSVAAPSESSLLSKGGDTKGLSQINPCQHLSTRPPKSVPPKGWHHNVSDGTERMRVVVASTTLSKQAVQFCHLHTSCADSFMLPPFGRDSGLIDAALGRAGLSSWATEDASSTTVAPEETVWHPPEPAATAECCLKDVLVVLPYGQDPGTAQRYTELWAKAFREVACPSSTI